MAREATARRNAIAYAKKLGVEHIRLSFRPGVKAGWPDDLFLIPGGRPLLMEFKAPRKEPTPLQNERLCTLLDLGYDACWVDNSDAARHAISSALDAAALHAARGRAP